MSTGDDVTRVAETVWPWRQAEQMDPSVRGVSHRGRAVIEACVAGVVGSCLLWGFGKKWAGGIVLGVATLVLVGGLWIPPLYRGFQRAGKWLAQVVGTGVTWLLLTPFFYLCFPIGRLLFFLGGKDLLGRRRSAAIKTYWSEYSRQGGVERYRKQY